jgi:serine phosphatase RsbU (regulator of sigma subunit)
VLSRRRVPRRVSRIGTGGAVLLATLILIASIVAVVAGFIAVRQLRASAGEFKLLFGAQENADLLVRLQDDEGSALRGYVISRRPEFAGSFRSAADPQFQGAALRLRRALAESGLGTAQADVERIVRLHTEWRSRVALPLTLKPSRKNLAILFSEGRVLSEQIHRDVGALRDAIDAKYGAVEATLEARIGRTVGYAIALVSIVGLAGLYLALAQRTTSAALERQHVIARHLQAALEVGWQSIPGSKLGAAYVSATREVEVGGDVFDAWRLDERRGAIMIADMSGKGIDAVVNTAFCKYSIRALLEHDADPAEAVTAFNRLFARTIDDPSMFAVMFLGVLDATTGALRYVSAGHEPAFVRHRGVVETLMIGGPIVGMEADSRYQAATLTLAPGDVVLLATDGLTEARDARGEMLGAFGAAALVSELPMEPQELCDQLVAAVRRRGGEQIGDDLALLALRFEGVAERGGQTPAFAEVGAS